MTTYQQMEALEEMMQADHAAMRCIESEREELAARVSLVGQNNAVTLRLFERDWMLATAYGSRLRSFEMHQASIERLRKSNA